MAEYLVSLHMVVNGDYATAAEAAERAVRQVTETLDLERAYDEQAVDVLPAVTPYATVTEFIR